MARRENLKAELRKVEAERKRYHSDIQQIQSNLHNIQQITLISTISNFIFQRKLCEVLDQALNVQLRKEMEQKIRNLEEEKLEAEIKIEGMSKIRINQEDELNLLRERKKNSDKEIRKLTQENSELTSKVNVLKLKCEKKSTESSDEED
nr:hypothetical protein pmam_25 [Pithovirus mammoth]